MSAVWMRLGWQFVTISLGGIDASSPLRDCGLLSERWPCPATDTGKNIARDGRETMSIPALLPEAHSGFSRFAISLPLAFRTFTKPF